MSRLLQELNVEPQNLMALGDGENDVEMLQVTHPTTPKEENSTTPVLAHLDHFANSPNCTFGVG